MRTNREEFLSILESVKPGISPKGVLEQSSCFVFMDGDVITFNDENSCRMAVETDDLKGAVHAAPLLAVLHKMVEDEIDIAQTEGELVVAGKRRKAGIRMEAEIFLPLAQLDKPEEWRPLDEEYGEALGMVGECAGTDLKEFTTACIHVHPKYMEAFDNYQMMRYKIKTGVTKPTLVKRDSAKHVVTMGAIEFSETKSWIHFRNPSGLVISCRRFMEDFKDLSENMDVEGTTIGLPKGLASGLEIAEIFSSENADDNKVTVELRPGKLKVTGRGVSGWYSEFKDVKYDGPRMSFLIAPKLLRRITEKHNEATIGVGKMKITGSKWIYLACLGRAMSTDKE